MSLEPKVASAIAKLQSISAMPKVKVFLFCNEDGDHWTCNVEYGSPYDDDHVKFSRHGNNMADAIHLACDAYSANYFHGLPAAVKSLPKPQDAGEIEGEFTDIQTNNDI